MAPSESLPPVLLPVDGPGLPSFQDEKGILAMVIIKYIDEPFIIEIDPLKADEQEEQKEEAPPQTLQEVFQKIENIDHPGELIQIVTAFIKRGNLTIEDKQQLQERCRAKIEKQRKAPLPLQPPPPPSRSSEHTPIQNDQEQRQPNNEQRQPNNGAMGIIQDEPKNFELSPIDNHQPSSSAAIDNDEESQLQIDESRGEEEEASFPKTMPENSDNANSNHSARESGEMRSEGEDMDMDINNANSNHSARESGEMRSEGEDMDMDISDDEGLR
uniref:Uncharacterized protein n=1 Tax=Panagrolaimus sp. ES5 TaxID=591445 RepID=A0AC34F596_9BILA